MQGEGGGVDMVALFLATGEVAAPVRCKVAPVEVPAFLTAGAQEAGPAGGEGPGAAG